MVKAKETLEARIGRKVGWGALGFYLLGLSDGLLHGAKRGVKKPVSKKVPPGAARQVTSEGTTIECPHCHKQTPRDSTCCIHCTRRIR